MSAGELKATLLSLGLSQYTERFIDEGFDRWSILCDITEADLDSLDVKLGHRRSLQRAIAESREGFKVPAIPTQETSAGSSGSELQKQKSTSEEQDSLVKAKRKYKRHPKPDEHAPEKPASAYVVFSNMTREEMKGEGLDFTAMAKTVGQRWQALDQAQREAYEAQATAKKNEYTDAMLEYRKTDNWHIYQDYREKFKREHGGGNSTDVKRTRFASDADTEHSESHYRERLSRSRSRDDSSTSPRDTYAASNYGNASPTACFQPGFAGHDQHLQPPRTSSTPAPASQFPPVEYQQQRGYDYTSYGTQYPTNSRTPSSSARPSSHDSSGSRFPPLIKQSFYDSHVRTPITPSIQHKTSQSSPTYHRPPLSSSSGYPSTNGLSTKTQAFGPGCPPSSRNTPNHAEGAVRPPQHILPPISGLDFSSNTGRYQTSSVQSPAVDTNVNESRNGERWRLPPVEERIPYEGDVKEQRRGSTLSSSQTLGSSGGDARARERG